MTESTEAAAALRNYLSETATQRDDNEAAFLAGWEAALKAAERERLRLIDRLAATQIDRDVARDEVDRLTAADRSE